MNQFGIISFNIISVKKESSHRSETITQALFGETFTILEQENEWVKIKLSSDGYIGWILKSQYQSINKLPQKAPKLIAKDWKSTKINDQKIKIPLGAQIWKNDEIKSLFGNIDSKYSKFLVEKNQYTNINGILNTAKHYLGTPYLWGGKSSAGIDCSGLCQIAFMMNGYQLPRDAYQQAEIGDQIEFDQVKKGDLAFFKNTEGNITHVGIIIHVKKDKTYIIHASGYVKIDLLDQKGIINSDTQEYSHQLAFIKRVIQ